MSKRLYVGKLPYSVTEQELVDLFGTVGTVTKAQVIIDRDTNRSKGFGFVEMENDEEALKAIDTFNNYDMPPMKLVVNEARPQENKPGFGGPRRSF